MTTPVNPLEYVQQFMEIGGQSTKGFNLAQVGLYLGLQLEEICEKLKLIEAAEPNPVDRIHLSELITHIDLYANRFKQGMHQAALEFADRHDLLDADIDLAWVSIGAAFSTSTNAVLAFGEVARANMDKYPDGKVLRDANGKIMKPVGWRGPNLTPYVSVNRD